MHTVLLREVQGASSEPFVMPNPVYVTCGKVWLSCCSDRLSSSLHRSNFRFWAVLLRVLTVWFFCSPDSVFGFCLILISIPCSHRVAF
jgi:hypothetical protein